MITLAVKDLYRFSREAADKAYRAAERMIQHEIEELRTAEAVNRMKEQTMQERLAAAVGV